MSTLKERLLSAEEDFLCALSEGDSALSGFERRWQRLIHDVDDAMESFTLDAELTMLVHATSLRISILADTSVELADNYNAFTSQLMDQITILMGDLTVVDDGSYPTQSSHRFSPAPDPAVDPQPLPLSSRKRRRDGPSHSSCLKNSPSKKRCLSYESDSEECPDGELPAVFSHPTTSLPVPTIMPPEVSSLGCHSRKRRLSDADADIIAHSHRPKRIHVGPRLHAVSDSFVARPISKFEPAMASRPASASFALDANAGWDISPLSKKESQETSAADEPNAPLFDSFLLDSHSSPGMCDLDAFLQGFLAPLPPLVMDCPNTPLLGSPVSRSSTCGDVVAPLDSSPSPRSTSCPSTPTQEIAIEVCPPCYHLHPAEDSEDPAVYGAGFDVSNITVSYSPKWPEWLDPLDPFVWLSAPPPPYSIGASCLQLDTSPSNINSGSKGTAVVPSLPTGALSAL